MISSSEWCSAVFRIYKGLARLCCARELDFVEADDAVDEALGDGLRGGHVRVARQILSHVVEAPSCELREQRHLSGFRV